MPNLDAFSSQIVKLVRAMPDEALLALVRQELGVATRGTLAPNGAQRGRATSSPRRRTRATTASRGELLVTVERVVKGASGLSAREVAKAAGVPQPRAASALKVLKKAKRIFQGGERRFARYAASASAAERASLDARKGASG